MDTFDVDEWPELQSNVFYFDLLGVGGEGRAMKIFLIPHALSLKNAVQGL